MDGSNTCLPPRRPLWTFTFTSSNWPIHNLCNILNPSLFFLGLGLGGWVELGVSPQIGGPWGLRGKVNGSQPDQFLKTWGTCVVLLNMLSWPEQQNRHNSLYVENTEVSCFKTFWRIFFLNSYQIENRSLCRVTRCACFLLDCFDGDWQNNLRGCSMNWQPAVLLSASSITGSSSVWVVGNEQ